ncbi:Crp/Fnr family transcriptional regulator [Yeosuana marina]|uniref:Crp/Fnr family transcriptional regulator n=1 Tax=Yeosuana marina TaxID=1565536 RepID=UPI0019CF5E42|nr:Crp/Fnr family transcriptional regulator [Yeosuana marina]
MITFSGTLKMDLKLSQGLISEIISNATEKQIPKGTEILREGQYVKVVPIVLQGLIKVCSRYEDKELLLYYIQPNESCIMSFSSGIKNEPSKVFAVTEEDTVALLLPINKINEWVKEYPDINNLFYSQYNLRYFDLIDTIQHVLFEKMDVRLYNYLVEKVRITDKNPLKISHRQIANELGSAREVITRVIKKLVTDGKVIQHKNSIEVL